MDNRRTHELGLEGNVTWMGRTPTHDDFGDVIYDRFVDGRTKMGPWAIMSPTSFRYNGVGLGVGKGQSYMKMDDGKFRKIA